MLHLLFIVSTIIIISSCEQYKFLTLVRSNNCTIKKRNIWSDYLNIVKDGNYHSKMDYVCLKVDNNSIIGVCFQ